jgi:hypothetical protein
MASNRNRTIPLLPLAARTATPTINAQKNKASSGVRVRISATAAADTPSVVFKIQGKTPAGAWVDLLASAAVTGISETVLTVYPGLTAAANVTASALLPANWRVTATHADADSITYSVVAELFA